MKSEHMAAQVAFEGIAAVMRALELLDDVHPSCHDRHYYAAVYLVSEDQVWIGVDDEWRVIRWQRVPSHGGQWSYDTLQEWPLEQWLEACEVVIKDHLEQEQERAQVAARRIAKINTWLKEVSDGTHRP